MDYLANYKLYLKIDQDASDATIESYTTDIKLFLNYEGTPKDIKDIKPEHIRSYIAHLHKEGKARNTILRTASSIRSFFNYLRDVEKVISISPAENIRLPKREKALPKHISYNNIVKMIEAAMRQGIKTRLLIELLYGSGARISEIIKLRVEDIDFEEGFLKFKGKGNKERETPIHQGCLELIKQYMKAYGITEGYLFPHKSDKNKHMTRINAYYTVKKVADLAGVDPKIVSPHVFRHSFATHLLDNGCDIATVQEYLGHENINTTKIYAKVTKVNKINSYKKYHPLTQKIL